MSLLLTKKTLVKQLNELGLKSGDAIMVHASLRSVGEILGGPDQLIGALLGTIGSAGTMMVYVGCQMPFDDVGRGIFSAEDEAFILENCPPFEPDRARASRDFGAFAELFRTTPGVICSQNPSCRMAAIGARAEWLLEAHPLNYGLGVGSPLDKFCQLGGKVILLGSDLDAVTLLHYAEAIAPIDDKKLVHIRVPLMRNGSREWIEVEEFNSSTGIRDWPDNYFAEIVRAFVKFKSLSAGKVGLADCYNLDGTELVQFAIPKMVQDETLY